MVWDTIVTASPSPYSWENMKEKALAVLPASITGSSSGKPGLKKRSPKSASGNAKKGKDKAETTPGILRLRGQKAKYQISDVTGRLAERQNVTLSVGWNVQPWVGALWWGPGTGAVPRTEGTMIRSAAFDFPPLKQKKPEGQAQAQASV